MLHVTSATLFVSSCILYTRPWPLFSLSPLLSQHIWDIHICLVFSLLSSCIQNVKNHHLPELPKMAGYRFLVVFNVNLVSLAFSIGVFYLISFTDVDLQIGEKARRILTKDQMVYVQTTWSQKCLVIDVYPTNFDPIKTTS